MSILGGIMGGSGGGGNNIFMQAAGAFMRGESPKDFMRNLANSRPELGGIDLSDINKEAARICRERGVDPAEMTEKIKAALANMK
jgi:hypothetical protein